MQFALLGQNEVGHIWVLLLRCLEGSDEYIKITCGKVFVVVTNIMRSIFWLRRDLALATLPQSIICMRRLFTVLAAPRPNLGRRQLQIVASKLPVWINPSNPLGEEEAKSFNRFLITLKTKNLTRHWSKSKDSTESLARPLSNHAIFLLGGYIKVVHDPLIYLPATIRRALESGLHVLCEIATNHSRNTMMLELSDAGERASYKRIWQEFEKQKYAGQG